MRERHPIVFRSRGAEADGWLADLVHQTAMYYEDRLQGGGFSGVLLCGAATSSAADQSDSSIDRIRRSLEERLNTPVQSVDASTAATLADRISPGPVLLDTLAPLVGLLRRGEQAAS
jgi:hypothetical protein